MGVEIERKFLLRHNGWEPLVTARTSIRQAYLTRDKKASVRVRIRDARTATLTIKSSATELRRLELEYPLPLADAEALMQLREGALIEKVRHVVPWGDLTWEIDVFAGDNSGLVLAEIELKDADQQFELPDWIGTEVTGQTAYYNSALVQRPFCGWGQGA
jgi:adenylate cyclase